MDLLLKEASHIYVLRTERNQQSAHPLTSARSSIEECKQLLDLYTAAVESSVPLLAPCSHLAKLSCEVMKGWVQRKEQLAAERVCTSKKFRKLRLGKPRG